MDGEARRKQIGSEIKKLRVLNDWSRQQAADELEMSLAGYGSIERGETDMCITRLAQIAEVFKADLKISLGSEERIITNFTQQYNRECNNWQFGTPNQINDLLNLKHELEKSQLIQQSQTIEIENLKQQIIQLQEINNLLKQNLK